MKRTAKRPMGYRQILTASNAKTSKGEVLGYYTGICYLSPANESGYMNTCHGATPGCIEACLKDSGHMVFKINRASRIDKTRMLVLERALFMDCLRWDIGMVIRRAEKLGMLPAVRFNGTSDIPGIAIQMAREFPQVTFYDYTKLSKSELRIRPNYHITYSHSGENLAECLRVLALGVNVSVVFTTRKGQPLPESWNGFQVIDGDLHDLRFLDPKGVVVGLRVKGNRAKKAGESAFVINADKLVQIGAAA